jgi:hypothetical protein
MVQTLGYAAHLSPSSPKPLGLERAETRPDEIELLFCGVCRPNIG